MSEKRSEMVIDPKDFPVFLRARMMRLNVAEYAAELGVTPKLVYMLLAGTRKPSAAILKKVGLKVVYQTMAPASERVKNK